MSNVYRRLIAGCLLSSTALIVAPRAAAEVVTAGQQDFADGVFTDFNQYQNASADEPSPFNGFIGSDFAENFFASWSVSYAAGAYASASLAIGLNDSDSAAPGNQVASLTVDGIDLTALLNAVLEASPATQVQYRVYTIDLPPAAVAALADGGAAFTLALQPPGLSGVSGTTNTTEPFNGAGLDFATLTLNVPEPTGAAALLLAGYALVPRRALRRRA